MKTIAIGSIFVLFAIVAGMTTTEQIAFADHATAEVSIALGSGVRGCEVETPQACYIPYEVTIDVGGEVTWTNDDTAAHTVTSATPESPDDEVGRLFNSPIMMSGPTAAPFTVKFEGDELGVPGTFDYFCIVHPWMQAKVIVQEAMAEEGDGELMVDITTSKAAKGEMMTVTVKITHMDGDAVEHVNYDVMATQDGKTILDDKGVHDHDGVMDHKTMALPKAASDASPVDVKVTFKGFGLPGEAMTGPVGEIATKKVVPEFGTIAMMILAVSIISIIAVTAKTRVIPRL
jgi:predicted secreted protein with PEFG-CTERM motif